MKILAVHGFLIQKRGAELVFLNMLVSLKKLGVECDAVVLDIDENFKNELDNKGITVNSSQFREWKLPYFNDWSYFVNAIRILSQFNKIFKDINKENYDVLFAHHYYYTPLVLPFSKKPVVYYCHEPPRHYYDPRVYQSRSKTKNILRRIINILPNTINKRIDKFCVNHADLILTNSDYEREYIWRTYGLFPVTNRLAVDLNKFKKLNLEKENLVISVGVIVPVKAHDFVIRSVALIPADKRPKVVVVGSSGKKAYQYELEILARKNEVELEIKINVPDSEIIELYNKAKVTAIAYIMEPSIEPESLGCETPIVAVREGGARETIVNGETGILTERDEKEFAHAIEYLLDNPEVAKEMGRKGRKWIEKNFTWDKCAENLENNFKKVLHNSNFRKK